jgi:hypothetical protein
MSMEENGLPKLDSVIFGEIQVLLAEKRTALASLRTGIAVFALPLSVLSALIATSRYYSIEKVMPLLAPLMLLNLGLVVLGTWLVFRSIRRIETRSFPNSLAATLATLPSMSLIPSAPFAISNTASGSLARNINQSRSLLSSRFLAPHSTWNRDVVFRVWFKYGLGADEGTMPIGEVCLPGKTILTPVGVYA